MKELARGAAHIRMEIRDGKLIVIHDDGTLLHQRPIYEGEWDELWNWIKTTPEEWEAEQNEAK